MARRIVMAGIAAACLIGCGGGLTQAEIDWCRNNFTEAADYGGGVPLGADWGGKDVTEEQRESCRRAFAIRD